MFYLRDSIWYLLVRLKAQAGSSNHEKRKYFRVPRREGVSAQHRQIRKKHPIHRPQSTPNKRKNETTFAASTLPPSNHTLTTHRDCAVNAIGRQHNHLPPIQIHANSLQYHSNASINKSFSNHRKPQMPSPDVAATFHFTRTA